MTGNKNAVELVIS